MVSTTTPCSNARGFLFILNGPANDSGPDHVGLARWGVLSTHREERSELVLFDCVLVARKIRQLLHEFRRGTGSLRSLCPALHTAIVQAQR